MANPLKLYFTFNNTSQLFSEKFCNAFSTHPHGLINDNYNYLTKLQKWSLWYAFFGVLVQTSTFLDLWSF